MRAVDSACAWHRAVPVLAGDTACHEYKEVLQCDLLLCMMLLLGGQCRRLVCYAIANMRARSSALHQGPVL